MEISDRVARLEEYHREDRILRGSWDDGHGRVCLLAAYSPEAQRERASSACPAEAMPRWLAHLTPSLDDHVSDEAWRGVIDRYVAVIGRVVLLSPARLDRLHYEARAIAVREARSHCTSPEALAILDRALAQLDRRALGATVTDEELAAWRVASREARSKLCDTYRAKYHNANLAWQRRREPEFSRAEAVAASAAEASAEAEVAAAAAAAEGAVASTADLAVDAAKWAAAGADLLVAATTWMSALTGVSAEMTEARAAARAYRRGAWDRLADGWLSSWERAVSEDFFSQ